MITRDFHAAEDIYQNLVLKSLNSNLEFEDSSKLIAWCHVVIRTEAIDWFKKQGRELCYDDHQIIELLDAEFVDKLRESDKLIKWSETLEECLKQLPNESRRLLNLRYDGNRKCGEVAQMMGISLDSVYKRLSRIHLLMRDCVRLKINSNSMQEGLNHGA